MHYWLQSARHDWDAAQSLLKSGKYDWSLFLGHLVIEKSLKAYWVRDNKGDAPPPFILKTNTKIEVHPFTVKEFKAADPFVREILRTGKRVY